MLLEYHRGLFVVKSLLQWLPADNNTQEIAEATSSSADLTPKVLQLGDFWHLSQQFMQLYEKNRICKTILFPPKKHIATDKAQIQKCGGGFLSYHHHWGPLLAPGNTQTNRRIPISSLQGSTTAYVSRDLLSHLPISKKDILQWMKVKIFCLEAKCNANKQLTTQVMINSNTSY